MNKMQAESIWKQGGFHCFKLKSPSVLEFIESRLKSVMDFWPKKELAHIDIMTVQAFYSFKKYVYLYFIYIR